MNYQHSDNLTTLHEHKEHQLLLAQTFSVLAALAVGCTGILPLVIIPLEAGPALKHGGKSRFLDILGNKIKKHGRAV